MNNQFKITNMNFDYNSEPMNVNVNFSASFSSGNTIAGNIKLTIDEFNANTEGLVGFSKMIKAKLVADSDSLDIAV